MIMCRKQDYDKKKIKKIIRKAFPELFPGIKKFLGRVKFRVEYCYKMYSSKFDCQVAPLEKENDWDKNPFMALLVWEDDGRTFCGARPVPGF